MHGLLSNSWRVMAKYTVPFPCVQTQVTAGLLWSGVHGLHGCQAVCLNDFWTIQTSYFVLPLTMNANTTMAPSVPASVSHFSFTNTDMEMPQCALFWTLVTKYSVSEVSFPGSQLCLTAFWLLSSIPERRWVSNVLASFETTVLQQRDITQALQHFQGRTMHPAWFQKSILFVKWSVTKEQIRLSDIAKNKVGLSKVKWCKLETICITHRWVYEELQDREFWQSV